MAYFHYLLLLQIAVVCVVNGANSNSGGNRAAQMVSGNMGRSPGMAMRMREIMSGQSPNNAANTLPPGPNEPGPRPGPPSPRVIAPPNIPFGKYQNYLLSTGSCISASLLVTVL